MAGTGETPDSIVYVLIELEAASSKAVYDTLERAEAVYTAMSQFRPAGAEPNADRFARGLRNLQTGKGVSFRTDTGAEYEIAAVPLNPTQLRQGGSRRRRRTLRHNPLHRNVRRHNVK
jgi:hypothetical protein